MVRIQFGELFIKMFSSRKNKIFYSSIIYILLTINKAYLEKKKYIFIKKTNFNVYFLNYLWRLNIIYLFYSINKYTCLILLNQDASTIVSSRFTIFKPLLIHRNLFFLSKKEVKLFMRYQLRLFGSYASYVFITNQNVLLFDFEIENSSDVFFAPLLKFF